LRLVVSHVVRYETQGSQNDAHISWSDQSLATGPRITVFVTRATCVDFHPPPATNTGACAVLSRAGWF
jgi:hypothetical protein